MKLHRVLELAHQSGCSAYDCEFITLAKKFKVPLVTSGKKLGKAFPTHTISPADFCSETESDKDDDVGEAA